MGTCDIASITKWTIPGRKWTLVRLKWTISFWSESALNVSPEQKRRSMTAESLTAKLLMYVHRREDTSTQTGLTLLFQDVVEHKNITQCINPAPSLTQSSNTSLSKQVAQPNSWFYASWRVVWIGFRHKHKDGSRKGVCLQLQLAMLVSLCCKFLLEAETENRSKYSQISA